MPSSQLDEFLLETKGDLYLLEKALGLEGQLAGKEFVRIDVPDPRSLNLRMPSGNDAGANPQWLPAGRLATGYSEAVIDQIPRSAYTETPLDQAIRKLRGGP